MSPKMLAIMAMMLGGAGTRPSPRYEPASVPHRKQPPHVPKGCELYEFGGEYVVARTYENAVAKARKRGLLE